MAALLRLGWLDWAGLQVDEVMSLFRAAQWRSRPHEDVHPPLFFALLEVWARGGLSEAWLRALPALLSVAGCVLWWRLMPLLGVTGPQRWAGLAMLACSFSDIQQAREVRMYSLLGLLAMFHVKSLLGGRLWIQVLTLLLALFTHVFACFLIPIGWFSALPKRRLLLVQGSVFLCWLTWAIRHFLAQQQHPLDLRQVPSLTVAVEALGRIVGGRVAAFGDPWSVGLGVVVLAWTLLRPYRGPRLVYAWALVPWVGALLMSWLTPLQVFEFKYLAWTVPAWIVLLVSGRIWWTIWLLVNLVGVFTWLHRPSVGMADWRGVAVLLRQRPEVVLVHPSMMAAPLLYYGVPNVQPVDELSKIQGGRSMVWVTTPNHPYVARQRLLEGVSTAWDGQLLARFPCDLPSGVIEVGLWSWKGTPEATEKQGNP